VTRSRTLSRGSGRLIGALAVASMALPVAGREAAKDDAMAQLQAGIAAVEAKEYNPAVAALSGALRGLAADPARQADLVCAYMHLGVAFAGLGQESPARSQFAQALLRQPDATLQVKNAPESARRIFQEARGEAAPVIAAAEDQKKKSSKKPLVLASVAAVGAGVGVATVAGGSDPSGAAPPPTNVDPPRQFQFASIQGNPYMSFGGGDPNSGTTLQVGVGRPRFLYRVLVNQFGAPAATYARLQITVDLGTLDKGLCWHAESAPFAYDGQPAEIVVDAFPATPSCAPPFSTLTVEARLFDRDGARQVATTIYTGGYRVVP